MIREGVLYVYKFIIWVRKLAITKLSLDCVNSTLY